MNRDTEAFEFVQVLADRIRVRGLRVGTLNVARHLLGLMSHPAAVAAALVIMQAIASREAR